MTARPSNPLTDTWTLDPETGVLWPPPLMQEFLDWFLDPRRRRTDVSLAKWTEHKGLSWEEVKHWWHDDRFIAAFNEQAAALNNRPDRVQAIINALYDRAVKGDIRAAELYLRYVHRLTPAGPKKIEVQVRPLSDLSEGELMAELERVRKALPSGEVIDAEVVAEP